MPPRSRREEVEDVDAQRADDAQRFLRLWRVIAIAVDTALIAFTTVVDTLGRLFIDPSFHVSEFLFGALISSWLILLGFEGVSLIRTARGQRG